jgi:phasin family protein
MVSLRQTISPISVALDLAEISHRSLIIAATQHFFTILANSYYNSSMLHCNITTRPGCCSKCRQPNQETEMNQSAEKFAATAKANLEAAQALAAKAQSGVEKLVDLNMATSKAAMSESFEHAQAVLSAKDPQAVAALQASLAKPLAEKTTAYAQEFQKIVAGASAEFTSAAQANMADVQKGFATLMESATKAAPAGSESAMAFFNQAMNASQNAFKTAQASAQQAVDAAQANFTAATKQATDVVKKATKTA